MDIQKLKSIISAREQELWALRTALVKKLVTEVKVTVTSITVLVDHRIYVFNYAHDSGISVCSSNLSVKNLDNFDDFINDLEGYCELLRDLKE